MFARINVVKSTGPEQVQVDMPTWNPVTGEALDVTPEDMKKDIDHILSILDDRANAAQLRVLEAYGLLNFFEPEVQARIIEIVDILTGRADAAYVVHRWQQTAEENAALEEGRLQAAAMTNGHVHD